MIDVSIGALRRARLVETHTFTEKLFTVENLGSQPESSLFKRLSRMAPRRFQLTLEGHGQANAYEGERVLVALERAQGFRQLVNLPRRLPVGCRRGGCGVCRVRVLEGDYDKGPMSRCHVTEEQEAAGVVLSCCIYPRSDLVLRLETPVVVKVREERALQPA